MGFLFNQGGVAGFTDIFVITFLDTAGFFIFQVLPLVYSRHNNLP
jgi:hypothetical protein